MKRSSSTLISIGVSAALIAAGIWFLCSQYGVSYGGRSLWFIPHGMMAAGGIGVVMIIFWITVVVALVLTISGIFAGRKGSEEKYINEPDALAILKRRYAKGEIDKAQFDAMRHDLNA